MGNWFTSKGRGLIFGLWTCHQYVGDIVAAIFSGYILHYGYDWRLCIIVPAIINAIWSFINFLRVPNSPEDYGVETEASKAAAAKVAAGNTTKEEKSAIGFGQAFMLPNVMNYAFAFGFFKLVNYAMFFQLPVILASHFDPSTSNIISALCKYTISN
jgi:MFS transporter, OPA family, solute carrier family 37 (glycerol-3-phosphate transporter), member 1/2